MQDKNLYTVFAKMGQEKFRIQLCPLYNDHTWAEDTAPQGCDRSAVQRPER
jgi:hypothetical protein